MNILLGVILSSVIFVGKVFAQPIIDMYGSSLSGFSGYYQSNGNLKAFQFESQANLGFSAELSDTVVTNIEIGLGLDPNASGFTGGVQSLQSCSIEYKSRILNNSNITLGYITTPYGQFAFNQTDNSAINSPFLYNDLGYSLLSGGSLVDFGANGIQIETEYSEGSRSKLFVFNGTDSSGANTDHGFGVVVQYESSSLLKNIIDKSLAGAKIGLSWMNSNDSGNTSAINANTTATIVDIKYDMGNGLELGGYMSFLTLDDFDSSTEDKISAYMIFVSKNFESFTVATRYSIVSPADYNASGDGITSALSSVGYASGLDVTDVEVYRLQLSGIIHLEEGFNLHNELLYDVYPDSDYNTFAIVSFASLNF